MKKNNLISCFVNILILLVWLTSTSGCAKSSYTNSRCSNNPLLDLPDNLSYSFIFDVYDPISYKISRFEYSYVVTVFTHKSRNGKLVEKKYTFSSDEFNQPISIDGIADIPSCEDDEKYVCQGLGGSEIWVKYRSSNKKYMISKYWSPEDQVDTILGKQLLKIKTDFDSLVQIDSIKGDFMKSLSSGRYSNFGGTEMRI